MEDKVKITAFHKAGSRAVNNAIIKQAFEISMSANREDGKDLWLGNGIYFWERYSDAVRWRGAGYLTDSQIVKANITCFRENFLNLDTENGLCEFVDFWKDFSKKFSDNENLDAGFKHDSYVDEISCNVYKRLHKIDLIKYSFPDCSGRPQYCATNNGVISDVILVEVETKNREVSYEAI